MAKKGFLFTFTLISLLVFLVSVPAVINHAEAKGNPNITQELADLKIAIGTYKDGLYKIAADYLKNFLKKYPKSKFKIRVSLLLADALNKIGKSDEALSVYRSILNKNTNLKGTTLIQIHYSIYKILKNKHLAEAIIHLKFIVDLSSREKVKNNTTNQAFMELIEYYKRKGKIHKAEQLLNKFLLSSPSSPWKEKALLQKVILLTLQKRFKESMSLLEPVIQKNKKHEGLSKKYFLYWAISNLELKRYCAAQKAYKKLIKPYEDTPVLKSVLSGYIISSYKCFADEHVRSEMFKSLIKQFKKRPSILFQIYNLEGLLSFREGKYKKSRDVWTHVLERFPDHPKIPEILIKLDGISRNLHDLKTWKTLLIGISKDKRYLPETREVASLLLGNLYFFQKNYEAALPFYFNIINKKRYRKFCLERIVLCYYYLGKYKEAKTNLGILLLENPQVSEQAVILFLQADLLLRSNKKGDALILLKKLVSLNPKSKRASDIVWEQKAKLELGKLYFLKKDYKNAKHYLIDVLRQTSYSIEDNRTAAFYLGLIAEQEKKPELSETYFQIASGTKNPTVKVEALFRLGIAKKALKSYQESAKIFLEILNKYSNHKEWSDLSRLQLAEIYIILQDYKKATPLIRFILEKSKDMELKERANKLLKLIKKMQNSK